ncbi:MAG: hypothetical protein UHD09_08315 [Bifidobacterium sp.]|nr:hypothetical protein [Bifidobacterium sp.]
MKTIGAVLCVAALCAGLSACGSDSDSNAASGAASSSASSQQTTEAEKTETPAPQPADLTGKWTETDTTGDTKMEAEIQGDTITINWVMTDSTALYWKGSYEAPTEAGNWSWTSKGDTEAMDASLLGSGDESKEFTYDAASEELSFPASAMGVDMTVRMKKA